MRDGALDGEEGADEVAGVGGCDGVGSAGEKQDGVRRRSHRRKTWTRRRFSEKGRLTDWTMRRRVRTVR